MPVPHCHCRNGSCRYVRAPFASVFRDLFASVVLVPKNKCKRSQLLRLLMSRKTRLYLVNVKSTVKIWSIFVAFLENMNFNPETFKLLGLLKLLACGFQNLVGSWDQSTCPHGVPAKTFVSCKIKS